MDKNQSLSFLRRLNSKMKSFIGKEVKIETEADEVIKGVIADVGDFLVFWDSGYKRFLSFWCIRNIEEVSFRKKKEK